MTNQEIKKLYERLKAEYIKLTKINKFSGLCTAISSMHLRNDLEEHERILLKDDLKNFRDTQKYSYKFRYSIKDKKEVLFKVSNKDESYNHTFAWHPENTQSRIAYLDAMIKIYE